MPIPTYAATSNGKKIDRPKIMVDNQVRRSPRLQGKKMGFKNPQCQDKCCLGCNASPPVLSVKTNKFKALLVTHLRLRRSCIFLKKQAPPWAFWWKTTATMKRVVGERGKAPPWMDVLWMGTKRKKGAGVLYRAPATDESSDDLILAYHCRVVAWLRSDIFHTSVGLWICWFVARACSNGGFHFHCLDHGLTTTRQWIRIIAGSSTPGNDRLTDYVLK